MSWKRSDEQLFWAPRPQYFTNANHCCECAEHDETLLRGEMQSIGLHGLGNPSWAPLFFATVQGKKYYLPAMVRLSLDTVTEEFYLAQCLFHLEADGPGGRLYDSCNGKQRAFVARFILYMIEHYPEEIDVNQCADDALRVYQLWAGESAET